ncbi:MAG: hypothetical protein U0800_26245 [Isosphaeraceae bacterium]
MRLSKHGFGSIALTSIAFMHIGQTCHGRDDVTEVVKKDYIQALKKLEREFVPVHGDARVDSRLPDGSAYHRKIDYWFNQDSRKLRVVTTKDEEMRSDVVYCSTPTLSFILTRKGKGYVVKDMPGREAVEREIGLLLGFALFPSWRINPYSFVPIDDPLAPISQAIESGTYRLTRATRSIIDGRDSVEIHYDYTVKTPSGTTSATDRLRVSPAAGWPLERMQTDTRDPAGNPVRQGIPSIAIRYRPDSRPIRTPEVVEVKRSATESDRYEFGDFHFETTPDAEFTTSYYGLPDMRGAAKRSGGFGMASWFLAIGVTCLALGIAAKILGDRMGRHGHAGGMTPGPN